MSNVARASKVRFVAKSHFMFQQAIVLQGEIGSKYLICIINVSNRDDHMYNLYFYGNIY